MARLDRLAPVKEVAQIARLHRPRVLPRAHRRGGGAAGARARPALAELTAAELVFPARHASRRDLQLQARPGAGRGLPEPAQEPAPADPRQDRCGAGGAVPRGGRGPAGGPRPALRRGRPGRKAIAYAHRAARQAIERSAMAEAIAQLHQGLGLLDGLPDGVARRRQELELQTTLGVPLIAVRGMAAPEVERAYARARELCLQVGDAPQLSSVLFGLWWFYEVRAELRAAHELAERLLDMARRREPAADLIQAHRAMGHTLLWLGEFAPALAHFEQAIALYDPQRHRSLAFTAGQEPGVLARGFASHVLWYLGYPDRALATMREALSQAREVAHPFSLAFALDHAAWLHQYRREAAETREGAEEDMGFSGEQRFPLLLGAGHDLAGLGAGRAGARRRRDSRDAPGPGRPRGDGSG